MNKELSKKRLPIKKRDPITPLQRTKYQQSYSYKNALKKATSFKNNMMLQSTTRSIMPKTSKEKNDKDLKIKQEEIYYLKEKQTSDKLQKIINHKDQIIANKNLKIKQLENETILLKSQIEKYRMQMRKLTASLEVNKRMSYQMTHKLSKK